MAAGHLSIISLPSKLRVCLVSLLLLCLAIMPVPPRLMPEITVSAINCNSLNMSTVTKHTRIRKFYGIASLKTDVIFLLDLRMCNKAGVTDMKFISDTFAIKPHCSYNFVHHSRANSRGVGILYKKSLNFTILLIH